MSFKTPIELEPSGVQKEKIFLLPFEIFTELEKCSAKRNDAMNNADLKKIASLIREGKPFLKKLKREESYIQNITLLNVMMKNYHKLVSDYQTQKSLLKTGTRSKATALESLRAAQDKKQKTTSALLKSQHNRILKTAVKIQVLKNRLDKLKKYEKLYDDFVKKIENSGSPQQVDLYIASIEKEQNKLMGNPPLQENPVALKAMIRFLQKKEKEARNKEKLAKSMKGAVVGKITHPESSLPLQILSTYIPNDLEAWIHEGITADQLKEAIKYAEERHDVAYEKIIESKNINDRIIFLNNINLLDEMIQYSETSKHNYDRRLNFSSAMNTAASMLGLIGSTVGGLLTFIPGANLIADGFKKTFEFLNYSTLVAGQIADPNASPDDKLAARRHYDAMKEYSFIEMVFAGAGTLTLATSAVLPLIATLAIPLAPALLAWGAATMMVSNIIGSVGSYKDVRFAEKLLKENPLYEYHKLEALRSRAKKGDKTLSNDEKTLLKSAFRVDELKSRYKSKVSASIGAGMVAFLAGAGFAAMIGFPPFGAAVATVFAVATAATAVYSAYQRHQEKKQSKSAYKLNEEIQTQEIRNTLEAVKPDNSASLKAGVNKSPEVTHTSALDHNVTPVAPTVSLTSESRPEEMTHLTADKSTPKEAIEDPPKQAILHASKLSGKVKTNTAIESIDFQSGVLQKSPPIPERPKNKNILLERHRLALKAKDKAPADAQKPSETPKDKLR